MEQMHLVVYLESLNCEEVKQKKGWYLMRNNSNGKFTAVPKPSNGKLLKQSTICSVCKALGLEIPPITSKEMEEMMIWINEDVKKRTDKSPRF